jgi:hypothetical protein
VDLFLSAEARDRRAERNEIRKVLDKLKKKERKLKGEAAETRDDDARAVLESTIKVVHAQRKKGLAALKKAKKGKARGTKAQAPAADGG